MRALTAEEKDEKAATADTSGPEFAAPAAADYSGGTTATSFDERGGEYAPTEPVAVPEALVATAHVGRRRYEGVARAEPADDTTLTWHMTYRTHHDGRLVAERTVSYPWHLLDEATLRTELAAAGLRAQPLGPPELGLYALTHLSAPIA